MRTSNPTAHSPQPTARSRERYRRLLDELRPLGQVAVAFSGGVDSTLLLHAAHEALGDGVIAVTAVAPYMARWEIAEAEAFARERGIRHVVVEIPLLDALRNNPADHCYVCKRHLFGQLIGVARNVGIQYVLDGSNVDDLSDYRPGSRALDELDIRRPLLATGMTKAHIRTLSRELGLPTWDKPAYACLLSRLPVGAAVEPVVLERIERAERFLMGLGFRAVRVRTHGDVARVEVLPADVSRLVAAEAEHAVSATLKSMGYRYVAVELAGYAMGSLNERGSDESDGRATEPEGRR